MKKIESRLTGCITVLVIAALWSFLVLALVDYDKDDLMIWITYGFGIFSYVAMLVLLVATSPFNTIKPVEIAMPVLYYMVIYVVVSTLLNTVLLLTPIDFFVLSIILNVIVMLVMGIFIKYAFRYARNTMQLANHVSQNVSRTKDVANAIREISMYASPAVKDALKPVLEMVDFSDKSGTATSQPYEEQMLSQLSAIRNMVYGNASDEAVLPYVTNAANIWKSRNLHLTR